MLSRVCCPTRRSPHARFGLLSSHSFNARLKVLKQGYKSPHTLLDYAVDRTLGTGSFGRVLLVQGKDREDFQAAKIIAKDRVVKTRQVEHTMNEKNILFCTKNNFVVTLYDYFQVCLAQSSSGLSFSRIVPLFAPLLNVLLSLSFSFYSSS